MAEPASEPSLETYDPAYFPRLFAVEDRHFWFRARNRVIATVARQVAADLPSGYRVLEVGCGTGNVLRVLEEACRRGLVTGMDLFLEGLRFARRRTGCPLVQGDVRVPPFRSRFDLIGFFDVLEHLPEDVQVLRDLRALLEPGGSLLLTVPAHPHLWSYFDEASHHCRRYAPAGLRDKLVGAGFRVEYMTQYMAAIYPLVWIGRRLANLAGRRASVGADRSHLLAARELRVAPGVNGLLSLLLAHEARLIARRLPLPFGTSLLALCRQDRPHVSGVANGIVSG